MPLLTPPVVANLMTSAPRSIWRRTTRAAAFDAVAEIFRLRQIARPGLVERPAAVHVAAGSGDRAGGVEDPRPLHPAALDRVAQRQRDAAVVAEVAHGGEAGAQHLHAVHLRLEGLQRLVVADLGQQRLLAAAVAGEMDVAVDQARKHVCRLRSMKAAPGSTRASPSLTETMRPLSTMIVDGPRDAFAGHVDQPAGMDDGRRREGGGAGQQGGCKEENAVGHCASPPCRP